MDFQVGTWINFFFDQDFQLKQLYYLLSILGFLYWISKMESVQFSSISLKYLSLSLTSLYWTLYLRMTLLLFFALAISFISQVTSGVPKAPFSRLSYSSSI